MMNVSTAESFDVAAAISARLRLLLTAEASQQCCDIAFKREFASFSAISGNAPPDHNSRCRLLALTYGTSILQEGYIRKKLLDSLPEMSIDELFAETSIAKAGYRDAHTYSLLEKREIICDQEWSRGTTWAIALTAALAFPPACAGSRTGAQRSEFFTVEPYVELTELHPYQQEVRRDLLTRIRAAESGRCMVTLPTGGGKTRVMVDSLFQLEEVVRGESSVIWVAQHDELCEQAVQCFAQAWRSRLRPKDRSLVIQRVWGQVAESIDPEADIIIGIPESIVPRLSSLKASHKPVACVVIDEAHNANAKIYGDIFDFARHSFVVGLTATPGSSNEIGTKNLQAKFHGNIVVPAELRTDAVKKLQDQGYLAHVELEELYTGYRFECDLETRGEVEFTKKALDAAGRSMIRNAAIFKRLVDIEHDKKVLCFTSSVAGARVLAAAMNRVGRTAASVDAKTDRARRSELIADFRDGELQFLFNYGVLSTGFDAPRTNVLVMARPTLSPVLLEQMLGRGLRGPQNGGTASCLVIWLLDNMGQRGDVPLGYERFLSGWSG